MYFIRRIPSVHEEIRWKFRRVPTPAGQSYSVKVESFPQIAHSQFSATEIPRRLFPTTFSENHGTVPKTCCKCLQKYLQG